MLVLDTCTYTWHIVGLGKTALFGNENLEEAAGHALQLERLGVPGVKEC